MFIFADYQFTYIFNWKYAFKLNFRMESIKELFKIGNGPSSSHTMGPKKAAEIFSTKNPDADHFKVELYSSLALTGKGHMTDWIIEKTLPEKTEIVWKGNDKLPLHPNGMLFKAYKENEKVDEWEVYSVGGGTIIDKESKQNKKDIYPETTMEQIITNLVEKGGSFWEYVVRVESKQVFDHLKEVWKAMKMAIKTGLQTEGTLPGSLKLQRKAYSYYVKAKMQNKFAEDNTYLFAYALAVSEQNASGGTVVTAPTCGSSGILPAILFLFSKNYGFKDERILRALATAGLVGNLVKENASVSGAEVGCQGEVGVACAMAAAAATQLLGGSIYQIEYAASDVLYLHSLKTKLDIILERESRVEFANKCFEFLPTRAQLDLAGWPDTDLFSH